MAEILLCEPVLFLSQFQRVGLPLCSVELRLQRLDPFPQRFDLRLGLRRGVETLHLRLHRAIGLLGRCRGRRPQRALRRADRPG